MLKKILKILSDFWLFTTSYSINVFPDPLKKEEENSLIEKMLNGDKDARGRLIEHNLRLVAHIVKKFENFGEDTDDLISIGTIGLIKGIDTYKPNKDVKITTYAARCIENEILMHFRANKKRQNDVSLNDTIGYDKDGNEITFVDIIKEDSEDISEILYLKDNINLLKDYIKKLTKREQKVIAMRYGLGCDELTQKEIADKLCISRSYVSRIEKRALIKMLREFYKNN